MYNYRNPAVTVNLITDRMLVRTAQYQDAWRLSEYYVENREHLKPWEPRRDESYHHQSGWQVKLKIIDELHKQNAVRYFLMLDKEGSEVMGVINFSNIIKGDFHACYLGYSIGKKWQGQGLMFEALQSAIRYMFRQQNIHRIMANYMPHNQRSGNLLARLGFEKEGYAKDYLLIDGKWQDHVLTALVNPEWKSVL